jgi:hypothetical protein
LGITSNNPEFTENFGSGTQNQHIYITNDEDIKEGDWCLDKFNQRWKLEDKKLIAFDSKGIKRFSTDNILGHDCKKIILTTDQDLIKDGVQAIDDEFLEWFLAKANDSGKPIDIVEVEVLEAPKLVKMIDNEFYKIIIPKEEETKCYCGHTTTCDCGPEELEILETPMPIYKHKGKELTTDEVMESRSNAYEFIDFDKQETIEEVAEKYKSQFIGLQESRYASEDFINGAKWQQEHYHQFTLAMDDLKSSREGYLKAKKEYELKQQERSYSEEEVLNKLTHFAVEIQRQNKEGVFPLRIK